MNWLTSQSKSRSSHGPVIAMAIIVLLMMTSGACNCGESGVAAPVVGEACEEEGERDGNLICVDGQWVEDDSDVGFDDADCQPESGEELCEYYEVECGSLTAEDNCGDERTVHCEDFDGFQCEEHEICRHADDDPDRDANECACPELGDDPAQEICDYAGAECGEIEAGDICQSWSGLGQVDCGGCEGDDECGEEIDNICGCPCEIDGECYVDGESDPDDACMICDSAESEEEFTQAADGTECDDNAICTDGDCVCEQSATECDGDCVDTDSDRDHCGECDNPCTDEQVCSEGSCEDACPDDQSLCDEECVDQDTNDEHCGECGNQCPDDAICEAGSCVLQCTDDEQACGNECVDTDSDPEHCGDCDEECTTDIDDAVPVCDGGACSEECADDTHELCEDEGLCTDTSFDADHCGECGNECGINEMCNDGDCVTITNTCTDDNDCAANQQCCAGQCIPFQSPC